MAVLIDGSGTCARQECPNEAAARYDCRLRNVRGLAPLSEFQDFIMLNDLAFAAQSRNRMCGAIRQLCFAWRMLAQGAGNVRFPPSIARTIRRT